MAEPLQRDPSRLSAGTRAPHSGVYRVYHYRHRLPHSLIVLQDDVLPACHHCGGRVEFVELMDGIFAEADYDFGPDEAAAEDARTAETADEEAA